MADDQNAEVEHQAGQQAGRAGPREQASSTRPHATPPEDELFRDPFAQGGASAR